MRKYYQHQKELSISSEDHYKKERIIDFFLNYYGYWTDFHVTLDSKHIERTFDCIINAEETGLDIIGTYYQDNGNANIVLSSAYTITVDKNNRVFSFVMPTLSQMRKIMGVYILPDSIYNIIKSASSNKDIDYTKTTMVY